MKSDDIISGEHDEEEIEPNTSKDAMSETTSIALTQTDYKEISMSISPSPLPPPFISRRKRNFGDRDCSNIVNDSNEILSKRARCIPKPQKSYLIKRMFAASKPNVLAKLETNNQVEDEAKVEPISNSPITSNRKKMQLKRRRIQIERQKQS